MSAARQAGRQAGFNTILIDLAIETALYHIDTADVEAILKDANRSVQAFSMVLKSQATVPSLTSAAFRCVILGLKWKLSLVRSASAPASRTRSLPRAVTLNVHDFYSETLGTDSC